ncbi:LysR family transcriptional regulator [Tistrella mobilis]|uniref:Transcriptional regulator, LysR family n=1 Tax=Tistrella mobilis (strain KA081020-065) TaxID=1110502 RepID=I3TUC3_TISMK|nr:LysR family transcriptional regulator [Tistrella mobilis]AFK56361.1 transcriptional regulator, LysR family [Tistrella mobilis KA081020-065]
MGIDHDDIPLNALRAFCEVARDVHVSRAAGRLGVSQSAVSRHLALLEAHMGAALLERQGRNVVLTELGRQLAEAVTAPLEEIAFSVRLMRRRRSGRRTLVVRTSLPTFAFTTLIPRIADFSREHGDVPIDVLTSVTSQELHGDFDVLITRDLVLPGPVQEWTIAEEKVVCVAAPEIARRITLATLAAVPLFIVNSRPDILPAWLAARGLGEGDIRMGSRYDHHYMALPAAMAGQGLVLAPETVVADYLQKGLLAAVPETRFSTGMVYKAYASDRGMDPQLSAAFCRWVVRLCRG